MRRLSIISLLVLLMASNAMALGPLLVFDPPSSTPYAYPGPVVIYTDNDPSFSLTGPVSNADGDARVADAAAAWTAVPTASFSAAVGGDFASVGLPNITFGNEGLVIGTFNGGGYHMIYDHDGSITANLAGPGVLGFSSPEFATVGTPDLLESYAVLNGATVEPGDVLGTWWQGVITHEMGHGINLAHTQCNGASLFFGDDTGPAGCALPYAGFPTVPQLETMYPFIDTTIGTGSGVAQGTVDMLDDRASLSDIYPDAGWPNGYGTISGTIYLSNGVTEVTGVNVIVRNTADPFGDCSSMLSGAFSQGDAGPDGSYAFHGLTPGQTYVVYVDEIVAGGFSTPAVFLPGPEEFFNGANETGDSDTDDVCDATGIVAALNTVSDADVIFNFELNLGDDSSIEVALPFTFNMCGDDYNSVWVGSNGNVTFGAPNTDFSESVAELMSGPPRIAPFWDDFDPSSGGSVTAEQVGADFVITWDGIPEFGTANSNTFSLTLRPDNSFNMDYPGMAALDGIVGRALGNGLGSNPGEVDLSAAAEPITGAAGDAVYEQFVGDNDLSGDNLDWAPCQGFTFVIQPAQMGTIYATTGSAGASSLYTINTTTGNAVLVGPTGQVGFPGLAINSSGEIWGAIRPGGDLYRIDAVTGQAYFQTGVDVDFLDAIAFDANDVLWGIGFDPPSFQLRMVNTSTGVTTPVGGTGDVYVGLAAHPVTDVLFGSVGGFQPVNPDAISTISKVNGAATVLGATGFGGATPDLAFDIFGNLYALKGGGQGANNLILINQTNGSGTLIGPTNVAGLSGMASWIEITVPTAIESFDAVADEAVVNLQWRVHTSGDDLAGFRVHRRDENGTYRILTGADLEPNARNYSDATVVSGKTYVYRLEVVDNDRTFFSPEVEVTVKRLQLELSQNNPNPFNPSTTIAYAVPTMSKVTLTIYDVTGRYVTTLVNNESRGAGRYSVMWNGQSASGDQVGSGVYFYRLQVGNNSLTKKMVLLK